MLSRQAKKLLKEIDLNALLEMKSMDEVAQYLIYQVPIFNCKRDMIIFLVDYAGKSLSEDNVDVPIRYYGEGEEIDKTPIENDDSEENLTDIYINTQLNQMTPK